MPSSRSTELPKVITISSRNSFSSPNLVMLETSRLKLADGVLDVMHDKGKALVEILQLAGVGQRLGGFLLDQIGGELHRHQPHQALILPVQASGARAAG